ncbi:MAG TPA: hypothetical protein VM123_05100 [archaeon]|nr:hypothetical protein [archaeon]
MKKEISQFSFWTINLLLCSLFSMVLFSSRAEGRTIFSEDFESGSLEGNWVLYHEFGDSVTSGFEHRPQYVHLGRASYRLTAVDRQGQESGSNIMYFFLPGEDKCHFRWYAMFAEDFDQGNLMHWVIIGGNRIDNQWSIFGSPDVAGTRPNGRDFFVTNLDTWRNWGRNPPPGELLFYTYHPEMKIDRDGIHYWGNMSKPEKLFLVERGRWYCFEMMVKLNTPGQRDGEQAFWVDGREIHRQTDIRWRDTRNLRLNMLMLDVYIHQARQNNTCWFDDVEISTDYIGPSKE